jgi:glycosyltransferase involved in cell wall biosynthesis
MTGIVDAAATLLQSSCSKVRAASLRLTGTKYDRDEYESLGFMTRRRLAIVSTHPIQYFSPVFRTLAESRGVDLRVFYTWSQSAGEGVFDRGFGTEVKWDVPLLEGYAYQFVSNVAKRPGLDHFRGLNTPTLVREIEAWGADAVLVFTWNSLSHLRVLRYFKGRIPVFFRGDSTLIDQRPWWRTVLRRIFLSWVYSYVDVAIAVGANNRDYFAWCGLPSDRIAIAPHSVDTARFAEQSEAHDRRAAKWREEMNIGREAIVILFAGKLQHKKNPHLLLEAFAALQDGPHLVFVGNGELEAELRQRAVTVKNVHFLPFQNQSVMPAAYRLGDVFVLPSQGPEETWGLALNEAMASGRPVIASTKVGGARDLVLSNENGWIFESGDLDGLRNVLVRAIDRRRAGLHAMGKFAQQQSAHFSTEESARRIGEAVLAYPAIAAH